MCRLILLVLLLAPALEAAGRSADHDVSFPWGIHVWTIPLTLLVGVFIGWVMRDRKAEMDEARQTMLDEEEANAQAAKSKEGK